ncbi:MAG: sortase [Leptolinea sp.]|nr:sortase [Leptolinea sp.]
MEEKTLKTSLKSILLRGCISVSLALGGLALIPPTTVSAATIVVTEIDDHLHGGMVGTCNSGYDCTLREAVTLANNSAFTEDTIVFAPGLAGATIVLNSTIPVISPITISGPTLKLTITGSGIRLFTSGSTLIMENLVLTGGAGDPYGGAINNQDGTLTVRNMTFFNNQATNSITGTGGAIYNHGTLTIEECTFQGNMAGSMSGGGAIFNDTGPLTITNSTFTTNTSTHGGAISLFGGTLSLTGSTFDSNSTSWAGGGIHLAASSSATIVNSTFYSNVGGFNGGGAINNAGTLNINFSTIANNRASSGSGINTTGSTTVNNTIVAMNADGATQNNCNGTIGSGSNNLTDDATCGAVFTYSTNIGLSGPANNGGDTFTFSLIPPSSAINAAASCIATDQRGVNRGTTCDIGAYEYDGQPDMSINNVTITEGNSGTATAAFTVTLTTPAPSTGVTFDITTADGTASTTDGDYVAQSLTSQTIPSGSSTYTINVPVNGDTTPESDENFFVNISNVIGAVVTDGQGEGTITNDDFSADLSVNLTDSPDPALAGNNLTYGISVSNIGPHPAANITLSGDLPAGTTFVSLSAGGWSCTSPAVGSSGTVTCTIPSLASSASSNISLTVFSSETLVNGTTLTQTVAVSSTTTDPVSANNSATATTTIRSKPLAITNPADSITYNSATLNGQVNPLGVPTGASFEYGSTTAYGSVVAANYPGAGTTNVPVSANLSGLSPATTYHYRVIAANSNGTSFGDDATFTTALIPSMTVNDVSQLEGNSGTSTYTFTVSLSSVAPASGVSFDIATTNNTATTTDNDFQVNSLTGLSISEGSDTSSFDVTVNGDERIEPDETFFVNISNVMGATVADGQGQGTITNDDTAGVTINPTSGLTTTETSGTATFTVALNTQPSSDVAIDLSTSDNTEGTISPTSLTFTPTNWNVSQTVTITGVDDALADGDISYTIQTGAATSSDANYSGLDPADVSITNIDDDTAGMTINPTGGLATTETGGTATFTVALNTQPSSDVAIGLSTSDNTEGTVSPTSLTFTPANWDVSQTVTISGVDDALADGDISYTIQTGAATSSDANYSGLDPADVSITNTDDDAASAILTTVIHNTTHTVVTTAAEGDMLHANTVVNGNGALTPTGNVTFEYFNNVSCNGSAADSETVPLDAGGLADMTISTALTANGLSFLARYGGDSIYPVTEGACTAISTSAYPTVLTLSNNTSPHEGQVVTSSINSVTVQFNMDVFHTSNSNQHSATYPGNYLLLSPGADAIFNTAPSTGCLDGVSGDDVSYSINSISYNSASFVDTIVINNGVHLPAGSYRFYACGSTSITDPTEIVELNNGQDSTVNFTINASGSSSGNSSSTSVATGFAPGRVTRLPEQPAGLANTPSELWVEIPGLGIHQQIVGVPQTDAGWDVSWLGNEIGYLQGTAFPTWAGNSVLTGHVTGTDGLPGIFSDLGTMGWGQQIIIHAFGQQYVYEVRTVDLNASPDTDKVVDKHEYLPWLTLITCRGYDEKTNTYRYRTVVRAVQVSVEEE